MLEVFSIGLEIAPLSEGLEIGKINLNIRGVKGYVIKSTNKKINNIN